MSAENEENAKAADTGEAQTVSTPAPITTPARLLDAACDVTEFCSDDETRQCITGVHLGPKGVEAGNGAIAIRVPYVATDADEFPPVAGVTETLAPVIAKREALKKSFGALTKKATLPILSTVRVSTRVHVDGALKVQMATTNLEETNVCESGPIDEKFPNLDEVWPKDEAKLTITLSAENLALIARYAQKHGIGESCHPIRFEFIDDMSAVRAFVDLSDGRGTAEIALMPMRPKKAI